MIETGTWLGNGVQAAFDSGFNKVYTCDINKNRITAAKEKFKNNNLIALNEPSKIALIEFLEKERENRCVIFLDGHSMPRTDEEREDLGFLNSTVKEGLRPCPLIEELSIINKHNVKNHTILIDDYQCFDTWMFDYLSFEDVQKAVRNINPNYIIEIRGNVVCCFIK